jgi:2-phosphoglycerate kinase
MTHYRAQPEDDAVLIVLCAVRDGQFGKSTLNEVIALWVAGQIGRTDELREVLRAVLMEPDPIKRNQLAAPVLPVGAVAR